MNGNDRQCAQRLSDYIDGLVVQQREAELPFGAPRDQEFSDLSDLSQSLLAIKFVEPTAFRDDLFADLSRRPDLEPSRRLRLFGDLFRQRHRLPRSIGWRFPAQLLVRTAATVAPLAAAVAVLVWYLAFGHSVSAAQVLSNADLALSNLVRPGQFLNRRWQVTEWTIDASGEKKAVREYVRTEWMDGADFSRVAGRHEENGRVYLAYSTVREDGEVRPRVYFGPGFSDELRGLLSIEPTRGEFQRALLGFGADDRRRLQTYLNRGYIFEPISGERRFNRSILENDDGRPAALPRVIVSLRPETLEPGIEVYAVRAIDPARVRFRWKSQGSPVVWLERIETVRYIARDTYLTVRAEETHDSPSGQRTHVVRRLLETRIVDRDAVEDDPFAISVPRGIPVRRQSADEQLSAVAAVLGRLGREQSR